MKDNTTNHGFQFNVSLFLISLCHASELKELIDTPLGPDTLDRKTINGCIDLMIRVAQSHFPRESGLMAKLFEMVGVCEEFPGKRIEVAPLWRTVKVPQRPRYRNFIETGG